MKHVARKRFGQNFLKDTIVIDSIIDAINPHADDIMVEIGPGLGAMTKRLIPFLTRLYAIELDKDLVAKLKSIYPFEKLRIHEGDVLEFDFNTVFTDKKLRIVGNLPYNISTPLLFHLTSFIPCVKDQHFMLQKEVVERMVAQPGTKSYGRLSVMLQWHYHMELLFVILPTAFSPPPKVDSAIVRMIPIHNPIPCSAISLEKVVTLAFSQRRKMVRNSLSKFFTETTLANLEIDPKKRAEDLSLSQYIALANTL